MNGSQPAMIADPTMTTLTDSFPDLKPLASQDCPTYACAAKDLLPLMTYLRNQAGYPMLVDLTAIDHGLEASPRFSGVYHLLQMDDCSYLRIHVPCQEAEGEPVLPSIQAVYPAANWHEREAYDMFGIRYLDHPDLRRILMWDEYPYFPLRKDFPLAGIEVPYPEADVVERTDLSVKPAPMAGGPFVSSGEGPMSEKEPRGRDQSWREYTPKE
jgi:NADH-quinone oxidoreductase subunit C